jgi:hypothetical protein
VFKTDLHEAIALLRARDETCDGALRSRDLMAQDLRQASLQIQSLRQLCVQLEGRAVSTPPSSPSAEASDLRQELAQLGATLTRRDQALREADLRAESLQAEIFRLTALTAGPTAGPAPAFTVPNTAGGRPLPDASPVGLRSSPPQVRGPAESVAPVSVAAPTPGAARTGAEHPALPLVKRLLSLRDSSPLIRLDRRDPMRAKTRLLQFRSFAVAFAFAEVSALGGTEVLKEMLGAWGFVGNWELSTATFQGKKFTRVLFNSITDASKLFWVALHQFSVAKCARPSAGQWSPIRDPPMPSLWKGPIHEAGYWPAELPGLVVWELNLPPQQALDTVVERVLSRLSCRVSDLPLFLDPQLICKPRRQVSGSLVSRVKVFAHHALIASIISQGPSGNVDDEIRLASFSTGCGVCGNKGHSVWDCPSPKIRLRLSVPFNLAFKSHLRAQLASQSAEGGLLGVWGGRSPGLRLQNKKFGYLAFASVAHRDRAADFLASAWPGAQSVVFPFIKLDRALLSECPTCGCSSGEPTEYGLKVHANYLQVCPNAPFDSSHLRR